METAVSVAIIVGAIAISIVAVLAIVILGYVFFIIRNVLKVTKRVQATTAEFSAEIRRALGVAFSILPKIFGTSERKRNTKKSDS